MASTDGRSVRSWGMECRNNTSLSRFEALEDGQVVGWLDFEAGPGVLTMTHTIVPSEHGGRGIGKVLVEYAVGYAADNGWSVVPECAFVRAYLAKNPPLQTLVPESRRQEFFPADA